MRCFTYHHETISKGIVVSTDEKYGDVVFLGSKNPGAFFLKVGLDKEKPARVVKGMLYYAYPHKILFTKKSEKKVNESGDTTKVPGKKVEFIVLAKPEISKTKTLNRIMGGSLLPGYTPGRYRVISGTPERVARAYDCRRKGKGPRVCDDLVTMDDGDVILIIQEGGIRENNIVLENNNGFMSTMPAMDYFELKRQTKQKNTPEPRGPDSTIAITRKQESRKPEANLAEPIDEEPLEEFEARVDEHIKNGKAIKAAEAVESDYPNQILESV
jgi:hypothetical protein